MTTNPPPVTRNLDSAYVLEGYPSQLYGGPISRAARLILSAGSRVSNTGLTWNAEHTRTANQGGSPSLIEPVTGTISLRDLAGATAVSAVALDGAGKPIGAPIRATRGASGWSLRVGDPVTTWYVVTVERRRSR